jgi:CubicO group peptidase (beta-lactamase class C family)
MSAPALSSTLPRIAALIEEGRQAGWHLGVQLYVSIAREVVVDAATGEAAPDAPLTPDVLLPWLSAGKPITAVALLQQIERGLLALDDPVVRYLPEFAPHGKNSLTLFHLLTHTAGLSPINTGWPDADWQTIVSRICAARLRPGWRPGEQAAYDPLRSWFILAEILQRIDGRPFAQLVREDICEPLGMRDSRSLLTPKQQAEYGGRVALLYQWEEGECRPAPLPAAAPVPSPGGSILGPARELGRFYELLLAGGELDGVRLLAPETVTLLHHRHRQGLFDLTFQHTLDFGLGVILNSNRYGAETVPYGFGRHASPEAFGHGGAQSSIAFADPRHELIAVIVANGMPGEAVHQRRHRELCSALYLDLGLT